MPRKKATRTTPTKVKEAKKLEPAEIAVVTKYQPQPKIGEPKLGVDPDLVTRVGLGNLTVVDNGRQTYTP
tara:strand:- start:271 stop:480 length:210 start_codon:yes stop_codon:yes gene_type:complete